MRMANSSCDLLEQFVNYVSNSAASELGREESILTVDFLSSVLEHQSTIERGQRN